MANENGGGGDGSEAVPFGMVMLAMLIRIEQRVIAIEEQLALEYGVGDPTGERTDLVSELSRTHRAMLDLVERHDRLAGCVDRLAELFLRYLERISRVPEAMMGSRDEEPPTSH
ncbi:MAG TPA: hypothetical protein VFD92_26940 [Candidatus Binatia bacterium]|nr:hypothetical protein [Candidatus Binatia bacterium]